MEDYIPNRLSEYTSHILHAELIYLLGDYDPDEHFGNNMTQLVCEYVGWEYGFGLASSCYEIK